MTQKEFLAELEFALEGKLPVDDIREIIADYKEIFDCGISDGKDEDEISHEIASPAKIARKILDDEPPLREQDRKTRSSFQKTIHVDSHSFVSVSKRFGAYAIDAAVGALLLAIVLFCVFLPFSVRETVMWTEGVAVGRSYGYTATLYEDEDGVRTRVEVRNKAGKRLFKGSQVAFIDFLDKNKIQYPEEFGVRSYVKMEKSPFPGRVHFLIFAIILFTGAGNMINSVVLWGCKGYTLGKRLFMIKVEKVDGTKITFMDAFLREIAVKSVGNIITGGLLNIGTFVWICSNGEQKTLHDLAAKTRVVDTKG